MEVLQTSALPLGDGAVRELYTPRRAGPEEGRWSGKRDSNPRLRPWQGRTLPLSYSRPRRTLTVPQRYGLGQHRGRPEGLQLRATHLAQDLCGSLGQRRVAVESGGPLERAEPRHLG